MKTADLDKVYEAVGKVLAEEKPTAWKLKAYKYYYIPVEGHRPCRDRDRADR